MDKKPTWKKVPTTKTPVAGKSQAQCCKPGACSPK